MPSNIQKMPPGLPKNKMDFGLWLYNFRTNNVAKPLGVQALSQLITRENGFSPSDFISGSTLHRYENGEVLPPLHRAKVLDQLYGANGWIELALNGLWRARWDPWKFNHGISTRIHAYKWHPNYSGVIWISIRPREENVGRDHTVKLEWGDWLREEYILLDAEGVVLLTGKSRNEDGVSPDCNLTVNLPVFALFGAGEEPMEERYIDIRRGWELREK